MRKRPSKRRIKARILGGKWVDRYDIERHRLIPPSAGTVEFHVARESLHWNPETPDEMLAVINGPDGIEVATVRYEENGHASP